MLIINIKIIPLRGNILNKIIFIIMVFSEIKINPRLFNLLYYKTQGFYLQDIRQIPIIVNRPITTIRSWIMYV